VSRFIELHVVQEVPTGWPNRDGSGQPKRTVVGGVPRLRISSQSWGRAMRLALLEDVGGEEGLRGYRPRHIPRVVVERLVADGVEPDVALLATRAALAAGLNRGGAANDRLLTGDHCGDPKSDQTSILLHVGGGAIDVIADAIGAAITENPSWTQDLRLVDAAAARAAEEAATRRGRRRGRPEEPPAESDGAAEGVQAETEPVETEPAEAPIVPPVPDGLAAVVADAVTSSMPIDVAVFGRFVASLSHARVDSALQIAHAIGTGSYTDVADYFVVVDDLARSGDAAAGYVGGERSLTAGTVYRCGVLDVDLLAKNLGAHPDDAVVAKVVEAVALAFVTSTPAGGTSRSVNATAPALALVGTSRHPINGLSAFTSPVEGGGNAAAALLAYFDAVRVGPYAFEDVVAWAPGVAELPGWARRVGSPAGMVGEVLGDGVS